jgi:hypothetical protein
MRTDVLPLSAIIEAAVIEVRAGGSRIEWSVEAPALPAEVRHIEAIRSIVGALAAIAETLRPASAHLIACLDRTGRLAALELLASEVGASGPSLPAECRSVDRAIEALDYEGADFACEWIEALRRYVLRATLSRGIPIRTVPAGALAATAAASA